MCEAVAVMPFAVTDALTLRSAPIVMLAVPVAEVVTGGTSLLPARVTVSDIAAIDEQTAITASPLDNKAVAIRLWVRGKVRIESLLFGLEFRGSCSPSVGRGARKIPPRGCGEETARQ